MGTESKNNGELPDVFEDDISPKEAQTVHRIRANSTIMHLNKLLGKSEYRYIQSV